MAWHTLSPLAAGAYRISEPFAAVEPRVGVATDNMYLVLGRERAALVDTGMGIGDLAAEVRRITDLPCIVLNTHSHWDHIGANAHFDEIAIHELEAGHLAVEPDIRRWRKAAQSPRARAALPPAFDPAAYRIAPKPATRRLRDGETIDLGGRQLAALHIPGHSPGHTAYWDEANGLLFTGDFAYRGPVFASFAGGDPQAFARSAQRLAALEGVTAVCPGHNDVVRDPGWLAEFARCVEAAVSGRAEGALRKGFFTGREFRFGDLSVWLPA